MMRRLFLLSMLSVAAAGCSSRSGQVSTPPADSSWADETRVARDTAGWCGHCNMGVYDGHRCGLTVPCALCKREQGARHVHEIVWKCDADNVLTTETHICNDAKTCLLCRKDKRGQLGTRGCVQCFHQAAPVEIRGITTYCGECNKEVGANHIHGKTVYCMSCLREAGEGHGHDATRLCMEHATEHAPDHVHGTTEYCRKCHRDAGPDHKHGQSEWCWRCGSEMDWPHAHHND